eukprot:scaffold30905_cov45-Cyclotella_meneghiniana.AAC.6
MGDRIAAMDDLNSFDPQALANIVWAYSRNSAQHPNLFQKVSDSIVAIDDLRSFDPQALANIAWAYATSNTRRPNLFQKVGDAIASSDGSKVFTTQALANIVWSSAKLDVKHPSLFKKIGKSIGALNDLSSFNSQALANIAWSFAVTDFDVPIAFNDVFLRARVEKQNEFSVKGLRQLYKWHIWQVEKSHIGLPEVLRERCEQACKNSCSTSSAHVDTKDQHFLKYNEANRNESSSEGDSSSIIPSISNPFEAAELESLTVHQLKDILRTNGLKVGGSKQELIARLLEDL